ncbi:MAG: TauD/TfdA family dioxygenase [Acidimicrobiales bacterium]|nr:TauD/TfdA family dioxygenase [Acidimicrobiales bacterium]
MTTIEISKMTPTIGAEISGVDLREPLDPSALDDLRSALLNHLVLVFRGQFLTPEQHVAFARQFGELHYSAVPTAHGGPPEVNVLDMTEPKGNGSDRWHSDSPFLEKPTDATFLNAVMMPPTGGDTCFANMYEAYENLSDPMKRYVEGLTAVHDVTTTLHLAVDKGNSDFDIAEMQRRLPPMQHPVVRTHPETGRRVLYVDTASTARIVGVPRRESEMILDHLFAQAHNAAVQCRVRWQAGDLVFYDNRCTQHVAVPDYTERRIMHLVSITGSRPV